MTDITTAVDLHALAVKVADALDATTLNRACGIARQIRNATTADQLDEAAAALEVLHGTIDNYALRDALMANVDRLRIIAAAHTAIKLHGVISLGPGTVYVPADWSQPPRRDRAGHELPCSCGAGYDVAEDDL